MRRFPVALFLVGTFGLFLPGCASDCDKICGKLDLCFLSQGFDEPACLDRCKAETGTTPAATDGTGGTGGEGGTAGAGGQGTGGDGGTGGTAGTGGTGGAGGTAGSGGEGGVGGIVGVLAATPPTLSQCANCYDQLSCADVIAGGCRPVCAADLNP